MRSLDLKQVVDMQLFTDIMKEEFEKANLARKEEFKADIMQKLGVIQGKL